MLMLSGPVELFLLFLIAACTCSVVMFICVGCSLCTFFTRKNFIKKIQQKTIYIYIYIIL